MGGMTERFHSATCVRCGLERGGGNIQRDSLCRDCKLVLTVEERELWGEVNTTYCHDCDEHFTQWGITNHKRRHQRRHDLVTMTGPDGTCVYDYRETVAA